MKHDFDSDFIQEVKYVFDFNYMMDVMDEVNNEIISGQEALDQVELHGNASLESLLLRQSKANPISSEEVAKTVSEWKEVKQFSFEIVLDENMNRNKQIKEFAIEKEVLL